MPDSFVTPWTVAHQAPLSMGFSRQEYWSGLPFTSPGDLPNPGIKPRSPALQADALTSEPPGKPSWTEEPGILQFIESQRVGHDWATFTSLLCTILIISYDVGMERTKDTHYPYFISPLQSHSFKSYLFTYAELIPSQSIRKPNWNITFSVWMFKSSGDIIL